MSKRVVNGTETRVIQDVPAGEFIRLRRGDGFTKKVYQLIARERNENYYVYYVDDTDDISVSRLLRRDAIVQVGFDY